MPAPPIFTNETKPSQILESAGRWLAHELGIGFRWASARHALQVDRGSKTYEVILQPSRWNRAGELTHASLRVTVRDKAFAAWRRRQSEGTMRKGAADVVWTCDFINIDPDICNVELFGTLREVGDGVRLLSLPELLDAIRTQILPKLELFESPARVANDLPDTWLVHTATIVEWATSLDDSESASVVAARTRKAHPEWTRISETGPAPLPADADREAVVATGWDLIEVLRADMRHFPDYREGKLTDAQLSEAYDLMRRWLTDLTDPAGPFEPIADAALTAVATSSWPQGTELSRRIIAFEAAAARVRRQRI
jgi:hypothetical protein